MALFTSAICSDNENEAIHIQFYTECIEMSKQSSSVIPKVLNIVRNLKLNEALGTNTSPNDLKQPKLKPNSNDKICFFFVLY